MIRIWNLFHAVVYVMLALWFYNIILFPMLWSNQSPAVYKLMFCQDGNNSRYISTAAVNEWDSRTREEEPQVQHFFWTVINGARGSDKHDQHTARESLLCVASKYNTKQTISRSLSSLQSIVHVLCGYGNILYTLVRRELYISVWVVLCLSKGNLCTVLTKSWHNSPRSHRKCKKIHVHTFVVHPRAQCSRCIFLKNETKVFLLDTRCHLIHFITVCSRCVCTGGLKAALSTSFSPSFQLFVKKIGLSTEFEKR